MKNQSKPSHSSSRETPSASDTFFAVSKRIVCGSRARFGRGVLSHASKAQKYEIELIPTLARRSCCDNPARSRIARKVIRVPPCCFPSVRSIKQNAPTEAEAFCDIKTCLICIFDPRMLHIISIHVPASHAGTTRLTILGLARRVNPARSTFRPSFRRQVGRT